jgi:parallel beta-helix repeat protein
LCKGVSVKKLFSSFITLSLIFSLCSLHFVNFVGANPYGEEPRVPSHNIKITEDGNVTGTDKIQHDDNVYTFTGDVVGNIIVCTSNITIDGAGHSLQGYGNLTGIWLQAKNNVQIKNLHVRNFRNGLVFTWRLIEGSNDGCSNITLSGNTITDNRYGITFSFSGNNHVLENTVANNTYGIYLTKSSHNTYRNNQLSDNDYGFWVKFGTYEARYFINYIDESNRINGKPIIYWYKEQDRTVPSDAGYVLLLECKNIIAKNLVLTNNSQGILLVDTNNSLITNNYIANNEQGILLYTAKENRGNTIIGNRITANIKNGIYSWKSENTIITRNNITNNQESGINFYDTNGTIISGNTITENKATGIIIQGFNYSNNNTISGNHIENNKNGFLFEYACNNTVTGNSITSNTQWGLILNYLGFYTRHYRFHPFSNNTFYHNNFVNNQQVLYSVEDQIDKNLTIDNWDNGFEGNYWGNYNGTDNNGDGIGDTPYILNEDNQDNNPLMCPSKNVNAGIWEWTQYNVDIISNSTISNFSFNPDKGAIIRYNVEGKNGTSGFCKVTIPKDMLYSEGNWTVLLDGNPITATVYENPTNTFLYFTYPHSSRIVEITGTTAISEFPSWTLILITLVEVVAVAVIYRQKLSKSNKRGGNH